MSAYICNQCRHEIIFGDEEQHIHCHSQKIDEIFLNECEDLSNAECQSHSISPFIGCYEDDNESESSNNFLSK